MSKRKRKRVEDDDWNPNNRGQCTSNVTEKEYCLLNCTGPKEKLIQLSSIESWLKLLDAAKIRQYGTVMNLAGTVNEGEIPNIKYHMKCRKAFTHQRSLDTIKNVSYFIYCYIYIFSHSL